MLPLIPEPLWDLMLSTNDCYPGCSCEADRFEIDPLRVSRWVAKAGIEQGRQALGQLDALLAGLPESREALSALTNVFFESADEAAAWLQQWRAVLGSVIVG
jgi:hypothetical protein